VGLVDCVPLCIQYSVFSHPCWSSYSRLLSSHRREFQAGPFDDISGASSQGLTRLYSRVHFPSCLTLLLSDCKSPLLVVRSARCAFSVCDTMSASQHCVSRICQGCSHHSILLPLAVDSGKCRLFSEYVFCTGRGRI